MKKTVIVCIVLILCALTLVSCKEATIIKTDAGSYEVEKVVLAEEYGGKTPAEGSQFLLISVVSGAADMDDMQSAFYDTSTNGCTVYIVGSQQEEYSIKSLSYAAQNNSSKPDIRGTLLFEVPIEWKPANEIMLTGERFGNIPLIIQKN